MSLLNNSNAIPTASGGYNLENSLRFRSSASAYLNRTPATAGNQQTWTWSGWVKRGKVGATQQLFASDNSGTSQARLFFNASDSLNFISYIGAFQIQLITTQVFRDPSAWYHIVLVLDTTNATASNRTKIYVNGTQVTAFGTATYSAQNYNGVINSALAHFIGSYYNATQGEFLDGYLTEVNFVDGQALTPSDFGEYNEDTGVWQPIEYTGTYGTNGFYLPMNQTVETYDVDYLVIAGGGGGGGTAGGGGGAGGYRNSYNSETSGGGSSSETALTLTPGTVYTVTVGAGGVGATSDAANGTSGSNSVFSTITSTGGGYGGYYAASGASGGAGGGGGGQDGKSGGAASPAGQGYAGGAGDYPPASRAGGGGGGAGAVGVDGVGGSACGAGGVGLASSITGSSVYRAGGGGGSTNGTITVGTGGNGGGGSGGNNLPTTAVSGTPNTGGGGGGGGSPSEGRPGGAGGSGVVILRMSTSNYSGTVTGSPTVTTDGSDTVIQFTVSGTYTA